MRLRILILWLLAFTTTYSNGVVAWNFPLAGYWESGPKRKLDAPPEPSVFFRQGDILHNVMPEHLADEDRPDWLVWNETSKLLVAKGSWRSIYLLADELRIDKLPLATKVVFDLYESSETGHVPAGATPACSFSAVTRNGSKFILEQTSGPWRIKAEGEPSAFDRDSDGKFLIETKLELNVSKEDQKLKVRTNVISLSEGSMRLARGFRDGRGIEVRVSFQLLLPDGREPVDEIFEERDGRALRLVHASQPRTLTATGYGMSLSFLPSSYGVSSQVDEHDPFTNPDKGNGFPQPRFDLPLVEFPDEVTWIGRPLLSLGDFPQSHGVMAGPDEKVGFDPLTGQLHFFTKDEVRLDVLYVSFLKPECYSKNIAVTSIGCGESCVSMQSGRSGMISYVNAKDEPPHALEAEVILGENERVIDVNMEISHGGPKNRLRTNVLLWDGSQSPVGGLTQKGQVETQWSLKAEVLRQDDQP